MGLEIDLVIFGRWDYCTPEEEKKAIKQKGPFGVAADFLPLANASGNMVRTAATPIEVASILHEVFEPAESRLRSLSFLCHSDGLELWLSGCLNADTQNMFQANESGKFKSWRVREMLGPIARSTLKGKILDDARITLYACHTGSHQVPLVLLNSFREAFELPCFGFKKGLTMCVGINEKGDKIIDRGWIQRQDRVDYAKKTGKCSEAGFVRNLSQLEPDAVLGYIRVR